MSFDKRGSSNPHWKGGMWEHPLYLVWQDLKARCSRPTHQRYSAYGGRGISVDPSWLDFWQFVADMGDRPEGVGPTGRSMWSVDRIDNDGNYSPENCRWATYSQQSKNRREQKKRKRKWCTFLFKEERSNMFVT